MSDWIAELKRLGELRDAGVLTESEFLSEKSRIMNQRPMTNSGIFEDEDPQEWSTLATSSGNLTMPLVKEFANAPQVNVDSMNRIGSYRIISVLGKGGMGEVYRARHLEEAWARQQGGDVALKMMRPKFAKDANFRERFIREAAVGKEVDHKNAARVHEVILDGDTLGLVMDLVEGQPLCKMIPKEGMSIDEVIQILTPLGEALDHLHKKGIIHRDLKPENIRVRPNGDPVILDFGIAKSTHQEQSMTKTGMLMGTVAYMAPEQIDAKNVGPEADRYALGVIAYEMLAGRRPWKKNTSEGRVYTLKLQGNLVPLHHIKPDIDERLSKCVMRMLSVRPDFRHSSCVAFVQNLISGEEEVPEESFEEIDKDSYEQARRKFADLKSKKDKLQLKISAEQTKMSALMRERDLAIDAAEKNFIEARKSAEKEVQSIVKQIDQALQDIKAEFSRKRGEREDYIKSLKEDMVKSKMELRMLKEEHKSGWSSFVSMFSAAKKQDLTTRLRKAESRFKETQARLQDAQENLESDLESIEHKEKEVCARFKRAGDSKLDIARTRAMKKINQANRQLSEIREKIVSQYNKTTRKQEQVLNRIRQELERQEANLTTLKENYPDDIWVIKTAVAVGNVTFEMVKVPTEKFWMGADSDDHEADRNEKPRHEVELVQAFWCGMGPVTQKVMEEVLSRNPSKLKSPNHPVENVTWFDAIEFCNVLSRREGYTPAYKVSEDKSTVEWNSSADGYRLPTESEWEYAALGGKAFRFAGSDKVKEVAWYSANSNYKSQPVKKKKPNPIGLYDMSGNVWEWCWDWYGPYPSKALKSPMGPEKGTRRVRRGGSWRNKSNRVRVTNRAHGDPQSKSSACGFRIVRNSL